MVPFTLGELATAVTIMAASLGGLLAVCFKSRCDDISCCFGCVKIHRNVPAEEAPPAPGIELAPANQTAV
jgi:hypothetical protein